ncbi:50S ribosomal protein L31 type B [Streptomyces sp. F001]|nr:50S ribosomal protein L31 type B [Streptomyces sp. F001]
MRPGVHPVSRPVVFRDRAAGEVFLTGPTADSPRALERQDGNAYPLVDVEISSASHPFHTA